MNETLSVIDEHITDMNTPRSSFAVGERLVVNDSGSDYSSHIDHRHSYIPGHETDEEERNLRSETEVMTWTPKQVAEGLRNIGVETRHCDVFKEQEITGEVLLAMDQASIFMKEFDLGLVGRRLRTWHKIKAFQDEVKTYKSTANTTLNSFGADGFSNDYERDRSRTSVHASPLSQTSDLIDQAELRQVNPQQDISVSHQTMFPQSLQRHRSEANPTAPSLAFIAGPESPQRPSAASIRDLHHSRRHSAADFASSTSPELPRESSGTTSPGEVTASTHKKVPSLDKNWSMASFSPSMNGRPFSAIASTVPQSNDRNTFDPNLNCYSPPSTAQLDINDRGYASGGEADCKKSRKVLKRRDVVSASHSRQNSHLDDQRRSNTPSSKRQSRFGSVDSIRDTVASLTSPASKLYHGNSIKSRFRSSTISDTNPAVANIDSFKDLASPAVTEVEYQQKPYMTILTGSPRSDKDALSNGSPRSSTTTPKSPVKPRIGLRAISDAVTGDEKASAASTASMASPGRESAIQSPARTGSTSPSGASQSIELESTDASSKDANGVQTGAAPTRATTRRKSKKDTSAYTRGLEQKSPQEQMVGCDYNGWMKKKSSNLMKTWKSRLFVLRGRRLSYYYSEADTEEKGLIDISSHRVLPADHDFITGFHATVTGAKASPVSPSNAQSPTLASVEAAAHADTTLHKGSADTVFIFKLVPPRTGLSRAVNFTKPTVHYFAVDNVTQGRLWMAALMKATIDRDETKPITTTFQQKTISLVKARALRHRPPALMGAEEKAAVGDEPNRDETGLTVLDSTSTVPEHDPDRERMGSVDVGA